MRGRPMAGERLVVAAKRPCIVGRQTVAANLPAVEPGKRLDLLKRFGACEIGDRLPDVCWFALTGLDVLDSHRRFAQLPYAYPEHALARRCGAELGRVPVIGATDFVVLSDELPRFVVDEIGRASGRERGSQ